MSFVRRVVIVDDDNLLRSLLRTQLEHWGFEAYEADSSPTAVSLCKQVDPDAVILDVDLGAGPNGYQLAEALGRHMPHLAIVFLTRFPDARLSISRMSPSLRGAAFVNKNAVLSSDDLLRALNAALADSGSTVSTDTKSGPSLISTLTRTQLDVLRLMHDGFTNAQIAEIRGTSISAVDNIVSRIFKALEIDVPGSNQRARAVRLYAENLGYTSR